MSIGVFCIYVTLVYSMKLQEKKSNKMSLSVSLENLIKVGEFKSLDTGSETKVVVSC